MCGYVNKLPYIMLTLTAPMLGVLDAMLKFSQRIVKTWLSSDKLHSWARMVHNKGIMGTSRIDTVVRDILQPLSNEQRRREAGRLVRRNDIGKFSDLYKTLDIQSRSKILSLLATDYGCDSQMIAQQCRTLVQMNDNSVGKFNESIDSHLNLPNALQRDDPSIQQMEMKLNKTLKPAYHSLLTQIGTLRNGVKLLIDMRYDSMHAAKNQDFSTTEIQGLR